MKLSKALSDKPTLYGIIKSNRKPKNFFGKNQFNSSFPVSLACYMRDIKQSAVYLALNNRLNVEASEISFDEVFNTTLPNEEIVFNFESVFEPYKAYSYGDITGIDLVIKGSEGEYLRALEIKLTVIPDSGTAKQDPSLWGAELVIRPASTLYCALGMFDSCKDGSDRIREIFEPVCHQIRDWTSTTEVYSKKTEILAALSEFQEEFHGRQKPFLLQPIWRTLGVAPVLDDNAFDIFVWSDFALCRTFIDRSKDDHIEGARGKKKAKDKKEDVNRFFRSAARLARILFELSSSSTMKTNTSRIYTEMAFGRQTDKEFALNGRITRGYMNSPRRVKPILKRDILPNIILNGGVKELSPERRFDQTIYFTAADLFVENNREEEVIEKEER